jgi:hypothetical protein
MTITHFYTCASQARSGGRAANDPLILPVICCEAAPLPQEAGKRQPPGRDDLAADRRWPDPPAIPHYVPSMDETLLAAQPLRNLRVAPPGSITKAITLSAD